MPDDLVVNLVESRAVVEALLDSLPQMFAGNSTVRLPAKFSHLSLLMHSADHMQTFRAKKSYFCSCKKITSLLMRL